MAAPVTSLPKTQEKQTNNDLPMQCIRVALQVIALSACVYTAYSYRMTQNLTKALSWAALSIASFIFSQFFRSNPINPFIKFELDIIIEDFHATDDETTFNAMKTTLTDEVSNRLKPHQQHLTISRIAQLKSAGQRFAAKYEISRQNKDKTEKAFFICKGNIKDKTFTFQIDPCEESTALIEEELLQYQPKLQPYESRESAEKMITNFSAQATIQNLEKADPGSNIPKGWDYWKDKMQPIVSAELQSLFKFLHDLEITENQPELSTGFMQNENRKTWDAHAKISYAIQYTKLSGEKETKVVVCNIRIDVNGQATLIFTPSKT